MLLRLAMAAAITDAEKDMRDLGHWNDNNDRRVRQKNETEIYKVGIAEKGESKA